MTADGPMIADRPATGGGPSGDPEDPDNDEPASTH